MKSIIRVESFEQLSASKLDRASRLMRREPIDREKNIGFATVGDLLDCLSRERIRLCEAARRQPGSVTALAQTLGRDRRAVTRDVHRLAELGLLRLRKAPNPGHGQITVVEASADRFELRAGF